jgi:hypothetical protein
MADYIVINGIRIASDFEPETFGRLTTIGPRFMVSSGSGKRYVYQVCRCVCGTIKVVNISEAKQRKIASCGCLKREENIGNRFAYKHGETHRTPEYNTWTDIRKRCNCKSCNDYPDYGGRGIKICDRWALLKGIGYSNFLEDMGRRPSTKHSIDRIDVNGDYCPENCRWATMHEQNANKRNNVLLTYNGETKTQAQWARDIGITTQTLYARLRRGWSLEKALTEPVTQPKK